MDEDAHLLAPDIIESLMRTIPKLPAGRYQYDAVEVVLSATPPTSSEACLKMARQIEPAVYSIALLAKIAARNEGDEQRRLLSETLERIEKLPTLKGFCIVHLLLPAITKEPVSTYAQPLVDIAHSIESQEERLATLAALLPFLMGQLLATTLSEVADFLPEIVDPPLRTFVIQYLASQLSSDLVSRSLTAAPTNWFERLVHDRGLQLLTGAWAYLWHDLDEGAQKQALQLILRIPDMRARAGALAGISRYLSPSLIEVALKRIYETVELADLAQLLAAVAPIVPDSEMDGFLAAMLTLDGAYTTPDIVTGVASRLTSNQFASILDLLDRHIASHQDYIIVNNIEAVAAYLPESLNDRATTIASSIAIPESRYRALMALASRLTLLEYASLLDLLMDIAEQIDIGEALRRVAESIPVDLVSRFLSIFEQQPTTRQAPKALAILASRVPSEQRAQVFAAARAMAIYQRIIAFTLLAPYSKDDLLSEVLEIARTSSNLDDRVDALRALAPHIEPEWWPTWLQLAIDNAHIATQSNEDISPEEQDRGISARHYDADQLLAQFLQAVAPPYQADVLAALLRELRAASDKSRSAEALVHVLDYAPDASLASNHTLIFDILQDFCDDAWTQSLVAHQQELPTHIWKLGFGITLRQAAQNSYFAQRDALDLAALGMPLHLIKINGQQKEPVGAGPGDVLALFFNTNLLRVRQQRRQLTTIAPRQVEVGKACLVQVNMTLTSRESSVQPVPARTVEIVVEMASVDGTVKFENGRVRLVDLAWNKDTFPLTFEVVMTELGEHRLRITVSSRYQTAIIRKAELDLSLDAVAENAKGGYTIAQAAFSIEPPNAR